MFEMSSGLNHHLGKIYELENLSLGPRLNCFIFICKMILILFSMNH